MCPSVRPFVCLPQAGINIGSRKQRHTIVTLEFRRYFWHQKMDYSIVHFLMPKNRRNSKGITPTGAPNRRGVGSNGDLRPIADCISETEQDRDIVTIWNANTNSYVLYRLVLFPVPLSDPNYHKAPISTFCIAFHIFVVSGD